MRLMHGLSKEIDAQFTISTTGNRGTTVSIAFTDNATRPVYEDEEQTPHSVNVNV